MFQQRRGEACSVQTDSATINFCQPAQEDQHRPPSVISGAISGVGGALGGGCTGFTVGDPPEEDTGADLPDAEGDVEQPEDVTELIDVDGDGEPDEVADDGETPEVHDDGETFDFEDGEVVEDGETADFCENSPIISSTTSPVDGAIDIILTPDLDWDAGDLDAGDILTYRVRVWRTSDPSTALVDETMTDSQYIVPAGILVNNENYSWQVDAWDTCSPTANLISSPIWTFTTEPACAPYTFTDPVDLSLPEDPSGWNYRYEGDVTMEAAGWTSNGSFAATPTSDGDIFTMSTMGLNGAGYNTINLALDNSVGTVVDARLRLAGQDGASYPSDPPFMLVVNDGSRYLSFGFFNDGTDAYICERANTGSCFRVTPADFHTYRIEMKDNDFMLYIDGALVLDGTDLSAATTSLNSITYGDNGTDPDSISNTDYLRVRNLGDRIPYASPRSFEGTPLDTGAVANGHEGSTISWNPASAAGTVTIAVRAADSLADLATAPWSAELTDNPATIPAGVVGRYLQWRITLTAPAPTTTPVVDQVSGSRTCL
jgi:hypothetical protein